MGINGTTLKMIALITMTIDHIGMLFFPETEIFRIIGRIAFPIFAYMIAEGAEYTHNKQKYFFRIFLLGIGCQIVFFVSEHSLYQCVLITFSISIICIYALQSAKKNEKRNWIFFFAIFLAWIICYVPKYLFVDAGYNVDYGFWGAMLPVFTSIFKEKKKRMLLMMIGLTFVNVSIGGVQWFSYLSIVFLCFYDGQIGKYKMKHFFYLYYPMHLGVLYLIYACLS